MEDVYEVVGVEAVGDEGYVGYEYWFGYEAQGGGRQFYEVEVLRVVVFYGGQVEQGWLEASGVQVGQYDRGVVVEEDEFFGFVGVVELFKAVDAVGVCAVRVYYVCVVFYQDLQSFWIVDFQRWGWFWGLSIEGQFFFQSGCMFAQFYVFLQDRCQYRYQEGVEYC